MVANKLGEHKFIEAGGFLCKSSQEENIDMIVTGNWLKPGSCLGMTKIFPSPTDALFI